MPLSIIATTTIPSIANSSLYQRSSTKAPTLIRKHRASASCSQKQQDGGNVDRRNVLVGLGGLCGASTVLPNIASADGGPIQPPDLKLCHPATDVNLIQKVPCCPPYTGKTEKIIDFKLPDKREPLRVRQSVERMKKEKLEKFRHAIKLMKELPADDPWNFRQQAQIHCAYCNDAYDQAGYNQPGSSVTLQVHGTWLFLPWHRYYIYFWERILGKLVGDDRLAIPYWNWDEPSGMRFPRIYEEEFYGENEFNWEDECDRFDRNRKEKFDRNRKEKFDRNPLYNCNRNSEHLKCAVMNYKYNIGDPNPTPAQKRSVIQANQKELCSIFSENLANPDLFMGGRITAGGSIPADGKLKGALEKLHDHFHAWCGTNESPYFDMGDFHTAARDAIFYAHHAQVDRLWSNYKEDREKSGIYQPEFMDDNWLDASFIFYDENRNIVKCKVRDCLDPFKLRYKYDREEREERDCKKIKETYYKEKNAKPGSASEEQLVAVEEFGSTPRLLDKTIRVLVTRPKISRTEEEKKEESEVIFIDDFTFITDSVGFEVYITKSIEGLATVDLGEFAGDYFSIQHSHGAGVRNLLRLAITNLLDDIKAGDSEQVVVSLVPRSGVVTIAGVNIQLVPKQRG